MKKQSKYIFLLGIITIIIGSIICLTIGFNIELNYLSRNEIVISSEKTLNLLDVEEISKNVLQNRKMRVKKVDRFDKAISIICSSISEDEKNNIINLINEKYGLEIDSSSIEINSIPNSRIRDIIKPYIIPCIIATGVCLIYFMVLYHKIGLCKILLKTLSYIILGELTFYSLIAITRIPFGISVNSVALGIYVLMIIIVNVNFKQEIDKILKNNQKEND